MNRKGFELAVGTLVVMVLGLLIVIGGSMLVWDIAETGAQINKDVAAAQQGRVRDLLTQGKLLAIYPQVVSVRPGKSVQSMLGIRNLLETETTFRVDIEIRDSVNVDASAGWTILGQGEKATVGRGELQDVIILVQPPDDIAVGTYTVLVTVNALDPAGSVSQRYDAPVAFSVRVE